MAKVRLQAGMANISGTIGGLTFRTMYGKTVVHAKARPSLPEHPTKQEKERYKRAVIIDQCVTIIQNEISDFREAISERTKIQQRISRLYERYVKEIQAPTKLTRRIMEEYRLRYRENLAKTPVKHRE